MNFKYKIKNGLTVTVVLLCFNIMSGQSKIPWYDVYNSSLSKNSFESKDGDCQILKDGFDESLKTDIKQFKSLPLFMHTLPEYKQWMDNKYLVECSSYIYQADKVNFLILELKINSKNARASYGRLEFKAQMKCFMSNGEYIYLENLERSKGKVDRQHNFTTYKGVFAIDNYEAKTLKKHNLNRIGLIWEEGYQEYQIQNHTLIKHQLGCL
ncbi:MAG: hypothetical protein HKN51_15605 [Saprospiraceae bacterium]|nr:hypothetical protein [Saprospiraceae bacterium]